MVPFFNFMPSFTISIDGTQIKPRFPLSGKVEQSWLVELSALLELSVEEAIGVLKLAFEILDQSRKRPPTEGIPPTYAHEVKAAVAKLDPKQQAAIDRMLQLLETEQASHK